MVRQGGYTSRDREYQLMVYNRERRGYSNKVASSNENDQYKPIRESRLGYYAERAALGLGLFDDLSTFLKKP